MVLFSLYYLCGPAIASDLLHVIASPQGAAILCTRNTAQDCFVTSFLAMTLKEHGCFLFLYFDIV